MSKTACEVVFEDEFEDWQYEKSGNQSQAFIENEIFPKLEAFDFGNKDEHYVKGTAHFVLFMELLPKLGQLGYTVEDLTEYIYDMIETGNNIVLH